jgi:hypothetical protein
MATACDDGDGDGGLDNGIEVCGAVRLATTAVAAHQQLATYIGIEIERGRDNEASREPPSLSLIMSSDQEVITVNLRTRILSLAEAVENKAQCQ